MVYIETTLHNEESRSWQFEGESIISETEILVHVCLVCRVGLE